VRPAPVLAVAASALIGVACGIGGGLLTDSGGSPHEDPLALGISLVNRSCTGDSLLVVASGNTSSQLASAAAEYPQASYLDTRASCSTAWNEYGPDPRYVAYLGPFPSTTDACSQRMTAQHRGDFVTRLHAGNQEPVRCLCYQAYSSLPTLRIGMDPTTLAGIETRGMQRVLTDLGYLTPGHMTGFYDRPTVDAVKRFQQDHGLPFNGVVNTTTWKVLITKGCLLYSS
jgi:hypothetical protein